MVIDPRPRQHLPRVAQEKRQERELLGRQLERMPPSSRSLRGEIDTDVPLRGPEVGRAAMPPDQRANSGKQLVKRKRFAQIIVRPEIKPADPIGDGIARRQEKNGGRAASLS